MIPLNVPQRLGRKAFFFILSKKTTVPLIIFIAGLVLLMLRNAIISAFVALGGLGGGHVTASASVGISYGVSSFILIIFLLAILIFIICAVISFLEYKNYTFTIGEFDVITKRGIFDRKETSIPFHQIDSVNIERNMMHQMMGLSRLVMITAAHEESTEHEMAEVVLEPIEKAFAEEIRELLERKIGVQIVKTEAEADKEVATNTFLR